MAGTTPPEAGPAERGSARTAHAYRLVPCPRGAEVAAWINEHGWVCGTMTVGARDGKVHDEPSHAAIWHVDEKECRDIDMSSSTWSRAVALNRRGHVVGEARLAPGEQLGGFLWPNRPDEPPSQWRWDALMPEGYQGSHAYAINEHGSIAGYAEAPPARIRGFLVESGGGRWRELSPLADDTGSLAMALNGAGHAVGNSYSARRNHAVIWPAPDGPVRLKLPTEFEANDADSFAASIAGHGAIAGACWKFDKFPRHACLWGGRDEVARDLHDKKLGWTSDATSVNRHGHVVGNYQTTRGELRGFLHDGSRMLDLTSLARTPEKLVLRSPRMIDDRGWIIGTGSRGPGRPPEAFVLRPA
ncbi:hypothetical protein [Aquisphaera insulae]|uniref:hypothetical protein n=1 Tax=Aquisphaera insulae TaxID=2712864 RepID=UPI0013E9D5F8|nr:hypothetical protein [Aquisphaera insulae]